MPTINDVMEMAEALESASVVAAPDRCVAVRNRNSKCRLCVDACIADAIEVGNNELKVSNGACVACGACVAVCPTGALISLDPMAEDLAVGIARSMRAAGEGRAVFACARMAARNIGDPDKYAVVPCLGRMVEEDILDLAANGATEVVLVDGTCKTCKYRATGPAIDATVATARTLLDAQGCAMPVTRVSEFPPDIVGDAMKARGAARRGFFTSATSMAKDVAMTAAEKAIADALHQNQKNKMATLRERLGVGKTGRLPQFEPERNFRLLDAMDALGESVEPVIDTRRFGSVSIDPEECTGCGMCVMFCPTGALRHADQEEERPADKPKPVLASLAPDVDEDPGYRAVEFSAADCVQCRLCADSCLQGCVSVSSAVETAELFDFEPRPLQIRRPGKRPRLFDRRR
ncbi:MAG: 4Fe-4S binding protein [Eggerthellaceae bacterium]|jgi:ferredoxin|nr:4Fe-4S binding protein [Eggerthellaceae bacterium]